LFIDIDKKDIGIKCAQNISAEHANIIVLTTPTSRVITKSYCVILHWW